LDDEKAASTEAAAQYQQLQREDNSEGSGSNSGIQERTLKEEVHIC
jgi:solute carrier family 35 protein F1/2